MLYGSLAGALSQVLGYIEVLRSISLCRQAGAAAAYRYAAAGTAAVAMVGG
jgi:hypothetical protein